MSDNSGDLGSFLSGFIIGGLVGAAVALLLAPQSGEETRSLIKEKGIELKDKASVTADEARTRAEQVTADARARAEELRRRGQELYEEQKGRIGKAIDAGKEAATRGRQTLTGDETAGETPVE